MLKKSANNKKIKILVALSGGVDSAVTAALLVKAGYSVTGVFMINYDDDNTVGAHGSAPVKKNCWLTDYRDAARVAAKLNIPIIKLNFVKEYAESVLSYMYKEYEAGRTPNPDIMCNKFVKFGSWLKWALEHGFHYLATGHYARLLPPSKKRGERGVCLMEAKDKNKDQTYFLNQLSNDQLQHVMFPVGEYTKPQVRKLAAKFYLPVANKEESMGICFIGEVPMKEFLQKRIKSVSGNIVLSENAVGARHAVPMQTIVGRHEGLPFYTIGQRHIGLPPSKKRGLRGVCNKPLYVVAKRPTSNELVVGYENDSLLYSKEINVENVNWINRQKPKFPLKCLVRLRHRQELQKCNVAELVEAAHGQPVRVTFIKPQRAVTSGQFAVFYSKGRCLGGGVIN